jgi:hypothetical protein
MVKEQRQRLLLAALAVVLMVVAWRQIGPRLGGRSGQPDVRGAAASGGSSESMVEVPEVVELRLADLERDEAQFRPGRDPFRFGEAKQVEAEADEDDTAEADRQAAALEAMRRAMEARASRESATPSRPALPKLDVKFLGSFGSRTKRLAVFSDGVEIFNVLEGGVLKDHFVIRQIGFESVDVGFADYPEEPPIRLAAGG